MPNGYVILPSSIHEVLAVPTDLTDSPLADMVREINASQVSPEEQLSNNIYVFGRKEIAA